MQTGVKSFGCEKRTAQLSPSQSWKSISPSVVWAVKFGASDPIVSAMLRSSLWPFPDHYTNESYADRPESNWAKACSNTERGCAPRTRKVLSIAEGRDAVDPVLVGLLRGGADDVEVGVALENLVGSVEADVVGEGAEDVLIGDVLRLGPVGIHEPLVHRVEQPLRAGMLGEAQRLHRVRDDLGVRVVRQPVVLERGCGPRHPVGPVTRDELLPRDALSGVLGVQVERRPQDRPPRSAP